MCIHIQSFSSKEKTEKNDIIITHKSHIEQFLFLLELDPIIEYSTQNWK